MAATCLGILRALFGAHGSQRVKLLCVATEQTTIVKTADHNVMLPSHYILGCPNDHSRLHKYKTALIV